MNLPDLFRCGAQMLDYPPYSGVHLDCHELGLHDTACRILFIFQKLLYLFCILLWDMIQNRVCHFLRQVAYQVCGIIRIHLLNHVSEFLLTHAVKDMSPG